MACRDAKIMKDSKEYSEDNDERGKISMKELFGRKNINKDGKEGKVNPCASQTSFNCGSTLA